MATLSIISCGDNRGNHQTKEERQIAETVDSVLATMSTKEKLAQLFIIFTDSQNSPERQKLNEELAEEGLGGLIVMEDALVRSVEHINALQEHARIPMLVSIDGEWGPSMRYGEFTFFPRQMQLGAIQDADAIYRMGRAVGEQCLLAGIHIDFAPVVDINTNPANPVIGVRSLGEDRERVAELGSAYMRGMQDAGIFACAKHFPGHGDTATDSHKALPILTFDRARLDSLELYPFRRLIEDGVALVMSGHLSVPAIDSLPASISHKVLTELLREELGFDGVIITDALQMAGLAKGNDPDEVVFQAFKAGVDILLMPKNARTGVDRLYAAFEDGDITIEELDAKVRRILTLKARAGMFKPDYSPIIDTTDLEQKVMRQSDIDLVDELSRLSMTLVANQESVLPLNNEGRVAYLGYGATWQAVQRRTGMGEGLSGFKAASGILEDGTTVFGHKLEELNVDPFYLPADASEAELKAMRERLSDYSLVIVGFHHGGSKPATDIVTDSAHSAIFADWAKEQALAGIYFGSPYGLNGMPWHTDFKAFMICYDDNVANETAAAQIVAGTEPACGRLPVSAGGLPCGFGLDTL